ncbi:MAG TPA: hypothetical protein VLA19_25845 [Herpetosiphonaceae bacterium]|nr:hypothetical protein [Herpetosiphonaceae bacterium]
MEKRTLNLAEIEAQTALELPDREMMLVTIVITNLLNNLTIDVDVANNNVALQVCAALINTGVFDCDVVQN